MNSNYNRDIDELVRSYTGRKQGHPEAIAARQKLVEEVLAKGGDPETLSIEVAERVEQKQRAWQRVISILVACFIVATLCLATIALFAAPPVNGSVRAIALTWLNVPTSVITPTVTLPPVFTPTVTPTIKPTETFTPTLLPVHQISGHIVQYGSGEGLANATVTFKVRSQGDETWQTQTTLISASDGSFSFPYPSAEPPEVQLSVMLPEPWQLWKPENVGPWVYETDTNSFTLALVDKNEATLELTAAAVRQFEGQVALSTASDGANPAGIAGATVQLQTCTQVADPTTCSNTDMTATTDEEGYFKLIHPSSFADPLAYRLVPMPPAGYATQPVTMTIPNTGDFAWDPNVSGLLSTQPLLSGDYAGLNMVLQLQSITILATDDRLALSPDEATWRGSDYPNPDEAKDLVPSYFVYTTTVPADALPTVGATWEVYLPAGEYYVEIWAPDEMSTHVKYSVELDPNSSGSIEPIGGVWSYQEFRSGEWFNFKVNGYLKIISTGEIVTIQAIPVETTDQAGVEYTFADTKMAIGPIRFVVGAPPP